METSTYNMSNGVIGISRVRFQTTNNSLESFRSYTVRQHILPNCYNY
jgi:hypothetical protein